MDPEATLRAALRARAFEEQFPPAAEAEARAWGAAVPADALRGRTDFRDQPVVTIDGADARDFDDALSLEDSQGGWKLTVHIADVSHYVAPGGALDQAARERSTSIYFPERAIPMLPPELSESLCSLQPERDRLVQSAVLWLGSSGVLRRTELCDGVIRSRKRLTYGEVAGALSGDRQQRDQLGALWPMLERMDGLARRLRQRRERRGALDFDFPEAEVELDPHGRLVAVVRAERTDAHRLVEEFMLLANEAVAGALLEQQIPALYRIHAAPDPTKLAELAEVAAHFGHHLPGNLAKLRPRDLQSFLSSVASKPEGALLHQLTLRALMQARYSAEPQGHFGLAAKIYTHFTSPIRRYPDLVVHRILRAWRRGELNSQRREQLQDELPPLAEHASERERAAAEAEYEVMAARRAALLADHLGEEFAGRITGVRGFGLFVELDTPFADGLVPLEALPNGPYAFEERWHELRGIRSGQVYRLSDPIRVRVERVDRLLHRVTFGVVGS
jgi:ribonuclease R